MHTAKPHLKTLVICYASTLCIALLTSVASILGLVSDIYPTEALQQSFMANDLVTLVIGVPVLLVGMWSARRGQLIGLLFWPAALSYGLYNYIIYLLDMPLSLIYMLYLAIVALSIYTIAALLVGIDRDEIHDRLHDALPARLVGIVLAVLGALFLMLAISEAVTALDGLNTAPGAERGLIVSDSLLSLAWVIGGVLLWRRTASGYVVGPVLLFQGTLLFIGLLLVMILQPILTGTAFPVEDLVVIGMMSLVIFVPFGLSMRGMMNQRSAA